MGAFDGSGSDFDKIPSVPDAPDQIVEVKEVDKVAPEQGSHDTTVLDSHYQQLRHYLRDIDGTSVSLQWYHVLNGAHQAPSIADLTDNQYNHQFRYIRNFKAKLKGEINFNKDTDTGISELGGTLNFFPGFTPGKYDLFVLDVGDGRELLFYMDTVEELGYTRNRIVEGTFKLIGDASDEIVSGLNERIVETVVFDKRYLTSDPFMEPDKVANLKQLEGLRQALLGEYFSLYYNTVMQTVLLEHDGQCIYDELVTQAVKATIPDYTQFSNKPIHQYRVGYTSTPHTLWDRLLTAKPYVDAPERKETVEQVQLVPTHLLPMTLDQRTLKFTDVTHFVWPLNTPHRYLSNAVLDAEPKNYPEVPPEDASQRLQDVEYYSESKYTDTTLDGFYALSGAFYQGEASYQSDLERLVSQYLLGETIRPDALIETIEGVVEHTDNVSAFYQYPICWMLINYLLR